ncbi:MAG: hypothetical protein PHX14_06010 [Syntrophomonadaceae bacterium]|nr:hypothetical protein [Syntrophomonadaceae bacterium]
MVTYTPRWKATIDGKPWLVYNTKNLILLKLPAGQHQVKIKYGMSWVGGLDRNRYISCISVANAPQCLSIGTLLNWTKNLDKSLLLTITDSKDAPV